MISDPRSHDACKCDRPLHLTRYTSSRSFSWSALIRYFGIGLVVSSSSSSPSFFSAFVSGLVLSCTLTAIVMTMGHSAGTKRLTSMRLLASEVMSGFVSAMLDHLAAAAESTTGRGCMYPSSLGVNVSGTHSNLDTARVFQARIFSTTKTCPKHSREYHNVLRVPGGGASADKLLFSVQNSELEMLESSTAIGVLAATAAVSLEVSGKIVVPPVTSPEATLVVVWGLTFFLSKRIFLAFKRRSSSSVM
mmetsp:Transcript_5762/g.13566  ORF Transcript_5762/g.13566 Transcript_5762/m.13566 type:complete len:248 (+) Transcript_5762:5846-6589(+)